MIWSQSITLDPGKPETSIASAGPKTLSRFRLGGKPDFVQDIEAAFDAEAVKRDRSPAQVKEFRLGVGGRCRGCSLGATRPRPLYWPQFRRRRADGGNTAVMVAGLGGLNG